ncbi:MAG: hypothetical protein LBQ43_03235 [Holosporales bacterium]|jgi:hypothetical protein|nr:hypothetical protein [Holosporales bacterium]
MKNISKVLLFSMGSVFIIGTDYMSSSASQNAKRAFVWNFRDSFILVHSLVNGTLENLSDFPVDANQCLSWYSKLCDSGDNLATLSDEETMDFVRMYFFDIQDGFQHFDWYLLDSADVYAYLIRIILNGSIVDWTARIFGVDLTKAVDLVSERMIKLGIA